MTEFTFTPPTSNDIAFYASGTEMLKLTPDGLVYKGQTIEDAGEAYKLFMQWARAASNVITESTSEVK